MLFLQTIFALGGSKFVVYKSYFLRCNSTYKKQKS